MTRKFEIRSGSHRGKRIEVVTYNRTSRGMEIKITHNVPTTTGKQLRWVQTITENGSFYRTCGERTYVDPFGKDARWTTDLPSMPGVCKADDSEPFYETDAEFAASPDFYDRPSEGAPSSGRTWLQFVTALTEVDGTNVHHLVAISWGFDRLADGTVKAAAVYTATTAQMKAHGAALKKMYPSYSYT